MSKQLKFTQKEQKRLPELISEIGLILLKKMNDGVESPTLEGTMSIPEENREIVFSICAQNRGLKMDENQKALLDISAKELSEALNKNKEALDVRMKACDHLLNGNEEVQIHVIATRDKSDFLDDFEMQVMSGR